MRDVAVIGVGETEFGELWDRSFRDLGIEAGLKAIQDAKLRSEDIDAVYIGNMSAGKFIEQEHVSALVADYSGLADQHLPTVRIEGGGACGAIAILQAAMAIGSGMHDIVIVGGAEKMTDVADARAGEILSATADQEWESVFGATFVAGKRAFHAASLTPESVKVAEVHDNFTISEIMAIEDLRFVKKGLGGMATEDGETALNAKISVNTSGGLKARGQPVGAVGIAQAVEVVRQLRGEAGKRQVQGAEVGLTHTLGGTGATAVVHLYGRVN